MISSLLQVGLSHTLRKSAPVQAQRSVHFSRAKSVPKSSNGNAQLLDYGGANLAAFCSLPFADQIISEGLALQ
jgi:hypothetical protein